MYCLRFYWKLSHLKLMYIEIVRLVSNGITSTPKCRQINRHYEIVIPPSYLWVWCISRRTCMLEDLDKPHVGHSSIPLNIRFVWLTTISGSSYIFSYSRSNARLNCRDRIIKYPFIRAGSFMLSNNPKRIQLMTDIDIVVVSIYCSRQLINMNN